MAQFDVYLNPSRSTKKAYPYLLDIQSEVISEIATRIVLPIARLSELKEQEMKKLTPVIEYLDEKLLIVTPQISAVPAKNLTNPLGSLAHLRDEIIASLDFALSGV